MSAWGEPETRGGTRVRVGIGVGVGVGTGTRTRPALRVEWGVSAEQDAQIPSEIDKIGTWVDPVLQIRDGDQPGGIDVWMGPLDDHVSRGVDVDAGRVARVGLHEPDNDGDVVGDALEGHGDRAVGLKEVDGAAIVVDESGGLGLERRVGGTEGDQLLADQPLGVLRVWQG